MVRYLLIIALIIPLVACLEKDKDEFASGETDKLSIVAADGKKHKFKVELATTRPAVIKGLMNREFMPEDHGMLFYFGGQENHRRFWMKNTLIPLDMIFIKADGTIHKIHDSAVPGDLTSILSDGPVAAVLEINGGVSKDLNLQKGDKVKHRFFE